MRWIYMTLHDVCTYVVQMLTCLVCMRKQVWTLYWCLNKKKKICFFIANIFYISTIITGLTECCGLFAVF